MPGYDESDSTEKAVDSFSSKSLLQDDLTGYNFLIKRAADTYGIQLEEGQTKSCFLLTPQAKPEEESVSTSASKHFGAEKG
ncbi:hypothetical protein NDU88_000192 [Pleurodeles waltl]|uniref:Uncharacterized protein n=1 Tax=Pleurodeles waltl TaxID=8319 RepID=A0AAV7P320_PLEWA|nr:hypothetical protein NDU88_000192 [Pleurodeles waltl]